MMIRERLALTTKYIEMTVTLPSLSDNQLATVAMNEGIALLGADRDLVATRIASFTAEEAVIIAKIEELEMELDALENQRTIATETPHATATPRDTRDTGVATLESLSGTLAASSASSESSALTTAEDPTPRRSGSSRKRRNSDSGPHAPIRLPFDST